MVGTERVYNVAVFGVIGSGKSSIINLLADDSVADISTGVEACTRRARWYPISVEDMKFRVWDTVGFNQAEAKGINPLSPYEQAHTLLRNLQGGIDLILLCSRRDGINASFRNLYRLLDNVFFGGKAQIALVFTHFDTPDDQWWGRNRYTISKRFDIPVNFLPYACVTTVQNGTSQPNCLYEQSRRALMTLLQETVTSPTPLHLNLSSDAAIAAAKESLNVYCQLGLPDVETLVETFRSPQRPFHAILFGEMGAGKSSVVNLVADDLAAEISSGIKACTLDYHSYAINTGLHQFLIWDTVGFNEVIEHSGCGRAIENAVHLIREVREQGGVDLLVFCKKFGRLTRSEVNNFKLFREFLCKGQVPVAFVITSLEHLNPMEEWWEKNGEDLVKGLGLKPTTAAGHACITSLAPEEVSGDPEFRDKRSQSRQSIQAMLEDSISYGDTFNKDDGVNLMAFLRRLVGLVRVGNPPRRERISVKNLMDRCELTREQAEELIKLLYDSGSRGR